MTVTIELNYELIRGNASATSFDWHFNIPSADVLYASVLTWPEGELVRTLANGVDYTATGFDTEEGGSLDLAGTPLPATEQLFIVRTLPFIQSLDINNENGFHPEVLEEQLDLIVMQIQQLNERLGRAVLVAPGNEPPTSEEILAAAGYAAAAAASAAAAEEAAQRAEDALEQFINETNPLFAIKLQTVADGINNVFALTTPVPETNGHRHVNTYVGNVIQPKDGLAYTIINGGTHIEFSEIPPDETPLYVEGAAIYGVAITGGTSDEVENMSDVPGATVTDALNQLFDGADVAIWDSGVTRTMKERFRDQCHLSEFGADPTGANISTTQIQAWLSEAQIANVKAVAGAGSYAIDQFLGTYEGLYMEGAGAGFWRAAPFSFFTEDATQDSAVTRFIMVGTPSRTLQIDNISASRQCGFDRSLTSLGITRNYNNVNDAEFLLWDGTNADAVTTTRATLRSFSAFMQIGSSDVVSRPSVLRNFMFVPNCPGVGETVGVKGYANQSAVVPFADVDFGLIIRNSSMSIIENVNIAGYYKERGVLVTAGAIGQPARGQGEHVHWRHGYIQGGLAVRDGDPWPIIAKTVNTFDVRWTASHRFLTSGSLTLSTGDTITYAGLTYVAGSPNKLRFTGVSDTSAITINNTSISTTVNGGVTHTTFSEMYLADQGYATRIEGPNTALGSQATKFRAALEMSGDPARGLKLDMVTPICNGPLVFHFGRAQNTEFERVYTEPKGWKLTPNGAGQTSGAVFIAGPQAAMMAEVGADMLPGLEASGIDFTGPVNMAPDWPATSGRMSGLSPTVDLCNMIYFFDWRRILGMSLGAVNNSSDLILTGGAGRAVGFQGQPTFNTFKNLIKMFSSGNIRIGDTSTGITIIGSTTEIENPVKIRLLEYTEANLLNIGHAVNTSGKYRGLKVLTSDSFKEFTAAGGNANSSWRRTDGGETLNPV